MMIGIAGVFGILLLISLIVTHADSADYGNLYGLYMTVFFIAGYIFTSRILSELNSPGKSYGFLTLPASTFEKFIGSWLLSSPVYVLIFMIFITLIYLISTVTAGIEVSFAKMFDETFFRIIWIFMVTQTIFFLGACTFKSYNLLKTLFALFLIIALVAAFAGLLIWILFGGQIQGDEFNDGFSMQGEKFFTEVIPFIFFYVLGPVLLVVSYFKLKEREV
ncbi:MAG TPA: hypothetical protein VD908_13050 [Cytophagales bacterium]|nr:hypothetical protein [Cytophagales bacterium]